MSFAEVVIILIVALIVIGPERLPSAARTVGRWVQGVKNFSSGIQSEFDQQIKQEQLEENIRKAEAAERNSGEG